MATGGISRRELLASAAVLFSAARAAQNPTYSTDVKVVTVLATVRNKKGEIVRNLKQDDFVLEDEGHPQTIRYFAHDTDLPLTLGLLVDTSLSERLVIDEERNASSLFFDQVLRPEKDRAFVVHFDREVELLQDLTSSREKLQKALEDLKTPERPQWGGGDRGSSGGSGGRRRGGGTTLYDAVLLASDDLMAKQTGRKALVMLSDGVDMGSKVTLDRAIESAQRANTLVYTILFKGEELHAPGGFMGPGMGGHRGRGGMGGGGWGGSRIPPAQSRPDGKKTLERLAKETGGSFFEISKKEPLGDTYAKIQDELRSQYSLGFSSDQKDTAGYRHLKLTTREKGLVVQAREGYYAG